MARAASLRAPDAAARLAADRLQVALEARQVAVSARGDVIRVSPHVYNDPEDLAALFEALRAAATVDP